MKQRDPREMHTKVLSVLPFSCSTVNCPKHKESLPFTLKRDARQQISRYFPFEGCAQFKTHIFGISGNALSDSEWSDAPLIAVVLPCPDPTGAQDQGGGIGVSRDLILESIWRKTELPAVRVAFLFITRGYSIKPKTYQGDLQQKKVNESALSFCSQYLLKDLAALQPERVLLCGMEAGQIFFQGRFTVPDFRRMLGLYIDVAGRRYPVQVTFNPHICTSQPAYISSLWEDVNRLFNPPVPMGKRPVKILKTLDEVLDYIDFLCSYDGFIAIDYETENLNRTGNNRIAIVQFATSSEEAFVIPIHHKESPFTPDELELIMKRLTDLFKGKINAQGWIAHGAKFENTLSVLHFGTMLRSAPIYDTQAMYFCLDETRSERKADIPYLKGRLGPFTLKLLAKDFLYFYEYDDEILALREDGALFDLPLDQLSDYGGMDAYVTYALFDRALDLALEQDYLDQLLKMSTLFYGPATRLCAHVETTGFKVNLKNARSLSSNRGPYEVLLNDLIDKLKKLPKVKEANLIIAGQKNAGTARSAWGDVPWVFDFAKPDQQRLLFYDIMGFEPVSWGDKSGVPSIDDEFYETYRKESPEVEMFAQFMETKKLRDTFVKKIMDRINPQDGDPDSKLDQRIRPGIQYTKLVTGRWSMTKPNLQQIPKEEEGADDTDGKFYARKAIKDLFTVDLGCGLIQVDYKVNEVRWAAILAQDEVMGQIFIRAAEQLRNALISGDADQLKLAEFMEDIHRNTAAEAFGKELKDVTKTERKIAKTITFGILFGQGLPALAAAIESTEEEAQEFQQKFFSRMVGVSNFIENQKTHARLYGFVEAPHGRRRRFWSYYLPESYFGKRRWSLRNERQAVNSPIQGIASDASMIGGAYHLLLYIEEHNLPWKIQNVVHDSCLIQTPVEDTARAIQVMESIFVGKAMEHMTKMGVKFNLPLGIDVEGGHVFWGSLFKWKGTPEHAMELQNKVAAFWANR